MFYRWFWKIVAVVVIWSLWGGMVWWVEPEMVRDVIWPDTYLPFYVALGLAVFYTVAVFWRSVRRAILTTSYVISQLVLMQRREMNVYILAISFLIWVVLWWLIGKKNDKVKRGTFENESEDLYEKKCETK